MVLLIILNDIVAPRNVSLSVTVVGSSARGTESERRGVLKLVKLLQERQVRLVEVGCGLQEKVLIPDRLDDDFGRPAPHQGRLRCRHLPQCDPQLRG